MSQHSDSGVLQRCMEMGNEQNGATKHEEIDMRGDRDHSQETSYEGYGSLTFIAIGIEISKL